MKTSNTLNNTGEVITKKDLRRLFFDSLSVSGSLNYEKQMDMGCAFSLAPILQKLYKNKEDLSEALKRHTEFYNVTPMFNPTLFYGYKFGVSLFQNSSEIIKKIFSAVTVIGLMVVGGMTASIVSINLQLAIGVGEGIVNIMDILNAIMPDILSLGIFVLVYWLLKKGTKATTILFGIIVVSIVGSAAGIF